MAENRHESKTGEEIRLPDLERPGVHFEESDVNAWAVGKFAIALVLICGVSLLLLAGFLKYLLNQYAGGPQPRTQVNVDARRLPPEPRLQDAPVLDLESMKAAEDQLLNGYAWVDQQHGIARIPVNRAMDIVAQKGFPARPEQQADANGAMTASTATVPTESGLGYIMQQPGGPLAGPHAPPQPPNEPTTGARPTGRLSPNSNAGSKPNTPEGYSPLAPTGHPFGGKEEPRMTPQGMPAPGQQGPKNSKNWPTGIERGRSGGSTKSPYREGRQQEKK